MQFRMAVREERDCARPVTEGPNILVGPVKHQSYIFQKQSEHYAEFEILSFATSIGNHFGSLKKCSLFKIYSNIQFQNTMCFPNRGFC